MGQFLIAGKLKVKESMRAIHRRLRELEKAFMPAAPVDTVWGDLVDIRDDLLQLAEPEGQAAVAQFKTELDKLGPTGLWIEIVRLHLREHGFVQRADESLSEMITRALDISVPELDRSIDEDRLGVMLAERFSTPE